MTRRLRTTLIWLAGVCGAVAVAGLLLRSATKPRPSLPLPNPNGYDAYVQAGGLAKLPPKHFAQLDHEALRAVIRTNSEALHLLRVGLTQRCVVPLMLAGPPTTNAQANTLTSLASFKCLAQLLAAEGRLAELEDRPTDAAQSYVDCIRFGNEQSRGGPLISRLVGVACEAIGYQQLLNVLPELSPDSHRHLIGQLDNIRRTQVPLQSVQRAERVWLSQISHSYSFQRLLAWPQTRRVNLLAAQKDLQSTARLTLLTVELSLRCYQAEHHRPPALLQQLSPKYLNEVPLDPFIGKPLVYRPQRTNWLLYSVGPDRVDSGSVPVIRRSSKQVSVGLPFFSITVPAGDVFYDSTW